MVEKATVIIPTKNGEKYIQDCISMVPKQKVKHPFEFEIIVIDSGSTDKTLEIAKSFSKVRLVQIEPKDFGHGKTRNLGVKLAKGEFLIFLNQDATPKDENWMDALLQNFGDKKVAGVYSRHIPRENAPLFMKLEISRGMGPIKLIKRFNNILEEDSTIHILNLIRFSTVSCAIRRSILEKFPFNEDIPLAEDQEWARRMLEKGYTIIYEPTSIILHSHNYTLSEYFAYHANCAAAFNSILRVRKSAGEILFLIISVPFRVFYRVAIVTSYAIRKGYGFGKILKEASLSFAWRLSGLLGDIIGNMGSKRQNE